MKSINNGNVSTVRRRRRRRPRDPDAFRTRLMKHVVAFVSLMVFFLISMATKSGGATVSDWPVVIVVLLGLLVYGLALFFYPIVHRAWIDSQT